MNKFISLVFIVFVCGSLSGCAVYSDRSYYSSGPSLSLGVGFSTSSWGNTGWGGGYGHGHRGGGHGHHRGHR